VPRKGATLTGWRTDAPCATLISMRCGRCG
jgi:hypothetical protein